MLAENRVLYITHENRMPIGAVVLYTGNFFGLLSRLWCTDCSVLQDGTEVYST